MPDVSLPAAPPAALPRHSVTPLHHPFTACPWLGQLAQLYQGLGQLAQLYQGRHAAAYTACTRCNVGLLLTGIAAWFAVDLHSHLVSKGIQLILVRVWYCS
jgi:hypothetical protein